MLAEHHLGTFLGGEEVDGLGGKTVGSLWLHSPLRRGRVGRNITWQDPL